MPPKVFVDDADPVAPKVKKERKKRAPLTASKKAALVKRLADARAKKKANSAAGVTIKVEEPVKKEVTIVEKPTIIEPPKKKRMTKNEKSAREKSLELQLARDNLELEKLKFEMESLKMKHSKPLPKIEEEEPTEPKSVPETMMKEPDVVPEKSKPIDIPNVPQKIKYSTRPRSVWDKYKSS
jgi:hypothetical protein